MRPLLVLLSCFLICGCAPKAAVPVKVDPVELEISRAVQTEKELIVDARVSALFPLKSSELEVRLSGLKEGQTVQSSKKRVSDILPDEVLNAGESALVSLSIPAEPYDEFQITTTWGIKGALGLSGLVFKELAKDCSGVVCERQVEISGEVVNATSKPVSLTRVALGVQWVKEGATVSIPEADAPVRSDEQVLELGYLKPGESKPFVVELGKTLPELPGGRFEPSVRLLK